MRPSSNNRPPLRDAPSLQPLLQSLLQTIGRRFYSHQPPEHFHRDRRMLLYALSWPAHWLQQRNLRLSASDYRQLIIQRLDAIAAHGQPALYLAYFPRYLLKCLQDHLHHHGEQLYEHIKHASYNLDLILRRLQELPPPPDQTVQTLCQLHLILRKNSRGRTAQSHCQLQLF